MEADEKKSSGRSGGWTMMAQLLQGESRFVEYKREYSKTLLKTVSAFSNYHDGYIVIGLSDRGEIIGVADLEETRVGIENAINDAVEPKPFFEIYSEFIEEKYIVILKVYKGDYTPYTINQKAYKRMDTSTVQVDRYAYEELILQGRNLSFEQLQCKQQKLNFFLLSSKLKDTINIHELTEDLLVTLGLKVSGVYNNAAALLSDNNPIENAGIQLIAYVDDSVLEIKDRQVLSNSSVLKQFDVSMDFYRKHINIREIIKESYRKTIEEIPLVAYREAIANAIVHRDYSRESDIRLEVFSDRVEIMSPGSLPIGISEDEYIDGRISIPRNRILADIFLRLKIIEKLATGIRRIKEYYRDSEVKPTFLVSDNSIIIVLPKIGLLKNNELITQSNRLERLTEKERFIYDLINKQGALRRVDIEKEIRLKKSQTIDMINKLRDLNIIMQVGNGPTTKYIIKPIK